MRVKICGMMRRVDVEAALDNGADAVGFIVGTPGSRRNLRLDTARGLMKNVPVLATKVAVTTASNLKLLRKICLTLNPDALQLHSHDQNMIHNLRKKNPELKIIIATAIRDHRSILDAAQTTKISEAILADTPCHSAAGGTGKTHNWKLTTQLRKRIHPHPLILAGGLTPANVSLAIRTVKPYAVDVSTGVETRIGVKNHQKMKEFIRNAKEIIK